MATATTKRAYFLGAILLCLGVFNLYLVVFEPRLHPQLVLFVFSIPTNSLISIFPHEPVMVRYGQLHPLLISSISATLGTLAAGYLDWYIFVPLLNWGKISSYRANRFYRFCMDRYEAAPFTWLLIAGFTPLPFVIFKLLAFSMKYPLGRYLAALAISRFPRYYLLAWLGHAFAIPAWVLVALFVLVMVWTLRETMRGGGGARVKTKGR